MTAIRLNVIKRLSEKLKSNGLDGFIVTDPGDMRYLLGDSLSSAAFFLTSSGELSLFVSKMDLPRARKAFSGVDIREFISKKGRAWDLGLYAREKNLLRVWVDDSVSLKFFKALKQGLSPARVVTDPESISPGVFLKEIRSVKTPEEIDLIRELARETAGLAERLSGIISAGMTDRQIVQLVEGLVRERGADCPFSTIAAVGVDSADPHAVPTGRELGPDEHLMLDFGMQRNGYCSDLTRTLRTGRINRQLGQMLDTARRAQDHFIKGVRPGVMISGLVLEAEKIIDEAGYADDILHGLGHGVGVSIHERPWVRRDNDEQFKENMVITVEPGLYRPGLGGVRIEDMVLVTSKGCEVLTR